MIYDFSGIKLAEERLKVVESKASSFRRFLADLYYPIDKSLFARRVSIEARSDALEEGFSFGELLVSPLFILGKFLAYCLLEKKVV